MQLNWVFFFYNQIKFIEEEDLAKREERASGFCFLLVLSASIKNICAKSSKISINTEILFCNFLFCYSLADSFFLS